MDDSHGHRRVRGDARHQRRNSASPRFTPMVLAHVASGLRTSALIERDGAAGHGGRTRRAADAIYGRSQSSSAPKTQDDGYTSPAHQQFGIQRRNATPGEV